MFLAQVAGTRQRGFFPAADGGYTQGIQGAGNVMSSLNGHEVEHAACPWYGAVHLHTRISKDGDVSRRISPRETLALARDVWQVDFALITDHSDYFWDRREWEEEVEALDACDQPGRFVALLGYEWTHPVWGHWNVYFRENRADMPVAVCQAVKEWPVQDTLPAWLDFLDRHTPTAGYIVALNHPASPRCVANLDHVDARVRLMEVVNGEGVHTHTGARGTPPEFVKYGNFVWDALVRGYRVGYLGALDYHEPRPTCTHLTGTWAPELTRASLFDALYRRRTFATTGQRTALDFTVNGHPMGSSIPFSTDTLDALFPLHFAVRIVPASRVARVVLYDLNGAWRTWESPSADGHGEIRLEAVFENEVVYDNLCNCYSRCFHVYVEEEDGNMAWGSPIYLVFQGRDPSAL
jgi:hypothetical protein